MAIPNGENARNSSLQEFIGFFKQSDNNPSFTNLFSVHFAAPKVITNELNGNLYNPENGDLALALDYYAKTVNLPSKQITTGQITDVGSAMKYVTGTTFSQVAMTFTMPRSQLTRNYFESWTRAMANDSNQYTDFYRNYVSPRVMIYKFERGGGDEAYKDPRALRALRDAGDNFLLSKKNKLTAAWELRNVYPYNIGSTQLDNSQAKTMDLSVQFYYERYRFWTEAQFSANGKGNTVTVETPDNVIDADLS